MHDFDNETSLSEAQRDVLLDDIDVRCQTNVATIREAVPKLANVDVVVESGNACDRQQPLAEFHSSELSDASLSGISPRPIMVGSVFLLTLRTRQARTPAVLAVCERCTMLSQTSFDLRFRFTQPLAQDQD